MRTPKDNKRKIDLATNLLQSIDDCPNADLSHIVAEMLSKESIFKKLASKFPTPFYCYDESNLLKTCDEYINAFSRAIPHSRHFYAIKVNHYSQLLTKVRELGFGADVSSGRELAIALDTKFQEILFSGPGKTESELSLATSHADKVTINIDSFGELRKIASLTRNETAKPRCGVRVTFGSHGQWGKFGIPISSLMDFLKEADSSGIEIIGVQFHISWNADSAPYEAAIFELSNYLKSNCTDKQIGNFKYIDFGGGFRPFQSEGTYPEDSPKGYLLQALNDAFDEPYEFSAWHNMLDSVTIDSYAQGIARAIDKYLRPLGDFTYYSEPGRVICNSALHVLLRVEDVKSDSCIILNGGTNIVGFERFEFDYFPVINITNPSFSERQCMVYGSLCMPQDYWGRSIFSKDINVGDLIVIPYQGALTYANMQDFIKGKVPVISMNE